MDIQILGNLRIEEDGSVLALGAPKQRALFAVLALACNRIVSVDELVEALWDGDPPRSAEHAVQTYVSSLRSVLPHGLIETRSPGYMLTVVPDAVDANRFRREVAHAAAVMEEHRFEEAVRLLDQALAAWRGPPLVEFAYDEFAQSEIRSLEEVHARATALWCEAQLHLGNAEGALPIAMRLAKEYPLRERPCELLMRALYRCGRHVEALRTYQQFRVRLGDELGIEPTPGLRRLEERILLHDLTKPPDAATAQTRNPYKGLRAFSEADAGEFFGRDAPIKQLLGRIADGARITGVVGPSGAGKSSLVRAGLIPALSSADERWVVVSTVPGRDSLAELSATLEAAIPGLGAYIVDGVENRPDGLGNARVLLFIDQFEELFTLVDDDEARRGFLELLANIVESSDIPVSVMLALRADFYDQPLLYAGFAGLFSANIVHVIPLTPEEYQAAALEPAREVGMEIESALLAALVGDVTDQPGALPMFEYALTEMSDRVRGRTLMLDDYRAFGGIRGVLTRTAEDLYQLLDVERQQIVHQLALRLVAITETGAAVRRRVGVSEITDLDLDRVALRGVLEEFGRHRLLTFDSDPVTMERTIEVAHEALLGEWDRLGAWIESSREDIRRRAALSVAMAEWQVSGRDPDYLFAGARLERCETWLEDSTVVLTAQERRFVDLAVQRRREELSEAETRRKNQADRERRARHRLWAAIGAIALLAAAFPVVLAAFPAGPAGPNAALMYEGDDRGYGSIALLGWERGVRAFDLRSTEVTPLVNLEGQLRELSRGNELIVVEGFQYTDALASVAVEFPDVKYIAVDTVVELPNVTSILFSENEGSFLAGAAAAMTSATGIVGFVGGNNATIIEGFRAGYEAGARTVDPGVRVLTSYVTTDLSRSDAFTRPDLGKYAADALYARGADVVYHAAGYSGQGVIAAAEAGSTPEQKLWVIGVDVDQYLTVTPGERTHVLTSMLKRVDTAVYDAMRRFVDGTLEPGLVVYRLADGGVELAKSGGFISGRDMSRLEDLRRRIVSGDIVVPDIPAAPDLVASGPEPTVSARVFFDGQQCTYDGPPRIDADDVLTVSFHVTSPAGGVLTAWAARAQAGKEALQPFVVGVGDPPDFIEFSLPSPTLLQRGAGDSTITIEPEAATYIISCLTGFVEGVDTVIPTAVLRVEGP